MEGVPCVSNTSFMKNSEATGHPARPTCYCARSTWFA